MFHICLQITKWSVTKALAIQCWPVQPSNRSLPASQISQLKIALKLTARLRLANYYQQIAHDRRHSTLALSRSAAKTLPSFTLIWDLIKMLMAINWPTAAFQITDFWLILTAWAVQRLAANLLSLLFSVKIFCRCSRCPLLDLGGMDWIDTFGTQTKFSASKIVTVLSTEADNQYHRFNAWKYWCF